jgi:cell wall-associated NlpC family hydrolase
MKRNLYIRIVSFVMCFIIAAGVVIATDSTEASAASKTTGVDVVEYATQFVGNPYRYGGTSLTKGADCSGFVMSVYKKFGYKLPHSSSEIATKGKKVSWSDKKPGDIICYYGHVAIYIGNNKIVHASSRKTGIKISNNAGYRKVRCVRRIIN